MCVGRTISFVVVGVMCGAGTQVRAAVVSINSEVRSSVQAFVDNVAESSDEAVENFGETGLTPPIDARAGLENVAADTGEINAKAVAVSEFRDPTQGGPQRNPEEISIEADCFSNDPSVRYDLSSRVTESRVVLFSAAELGNPAGGTQAVRSAIFASGAIFAWSTEADRDLTGLLGEVSFEVRRVNADESETVLVSDRVALRGGPGGVISFEDAENLLVFFGDVAILPDNATVGGVSGLPDVNLGTLAVAQVAVILQQDLEYSYTATEDEAFTLVAEFSTSVSNLPGGTGVVAVFGRPFDDAAEVLEIGIPEESAKRLEARLNRAIAEFKPVGPTGTGSTLGSPCGMLGFEVFPLLALSYAFFHSRGLRRCRWETGA